MKKGLIPILLIALYLNPIWAQIKKGSWLIGGNGSFEQSRLVDKTGRSTSSATFENFYFNPELGYFITNRWIIGARAGFSLFTVSFTDINGQARRQTSYESASVEPFTRIYLNPQNPFKLFYEFSAGSFLSKYNNVVPALDSLRRQSSFYISNMIGVNYFLTNNIAIEGFINYNLYNRFKNPNRTIETSFPKFHFNPIFRMRLFLNAKGEIKGLAQKYFAKGNLTYGVRMNLFFSKSDLFDASGFTPSFGYFAMDNLMIGGEFSISHANSALGIRLSPEIRYYKPLSDSYQWFGRLLVSSTYLSETQNGIPSKFRRLDVEMGLGVNRFLAPNISIQSSLNAYISTNNLSENIELKPNLKLGFQYFMSKK